MITWLLSLAMVAWLFSVAIGEDYSWFCCYKMTFWRRQLEKTETWLYGFGGMV